MPIFDDQDFLSFFKKHSKLQTFAETLYLSEDSEGKISGNFISLDDF